MPAMDQKDVRFFSGSSHRQLAAGITSYLNVRLEDTYCSRYSNDNLHVQLGASVRGRVVFIIQSLVAPVSDHLLELLMMLDIARSAGAREVHAIIPYFSYARSDKKDAPRISITARLVADLLQTAGATHVMTMTLHSPQVHGFFSIPTDPLTARPLFDLYFRDQKFSRKETIVVAPDIGHAKPAARFAERLGSDFAAAEKTRISEAKVVINPLIKRQVKGYRRALIYDDEIATGNSVLELIPLLLESKVREIATICTHGLFTGDSLLRLASIPNLTQLVTTDTVPISPEKRIPKLTVLSVAPIFGEAIWRNYCRQSIGDLFSFWEEKTETNKVSQ